MYLRRVVVVLVMVAVVLVWQWWVVFFGLVVFSGVGVVGRNRESKNQINAKTHNATGHRISDSQNEWFHKINQKENIKRKWPNARNRCGS